MPLTVTDLHKYYPTRSGQLAVIEGVTFSLKENDAIAIMGPSGSGKSTLLHILGTLDKPTRGTIDVDGQNPFALDDTALAKFRNERIGFIFQDHHLLPQFNVLENVLIPTLVNPNRDIAALETTARQLLDRVGLAARLDHRPAELSGGERQRVAIARALVQKPRLVLADEPTGNLDRKNAQAVGELLLELHKQEGTMLIAVTHSSELARSFPIRGAMHDGRLVGDS
jgi:lipoprotein-releasing system ATP-binding protein